MAVAVTTGTAATVAAPASKTTDSKTPDALHRAFFHAIANNPDRPGIRTL